jgi:hypothetical protein
MANNLDDPKNIAGLSNLLRDDDIESTMDLAELEKEIANGSHIHQEAEVDVADEYRKEMDMLSRNFDIGVSSTDLDDNADTAQNDQYTNITPASPVTIEHHSNDIPSYNSYNSPRHSQINEYATHTTETKGRQNWNDPVDEQLCNMTIEEKKQEKINSVLKNIDDRELEFNIDKERDEDDKASLLEQIDMLKITLEDDGVDISGIPPINKQSSVKDVQNIYKILRLKNDRNRYCSFAEELILSGAYGMEYLFDGNRYCMGRTPDLTGWSDTVKVKLRRMRYETSTFVQEVMQEYNLSSGVRLALELIPSMFLYSRNRRLSQNDNLVSDDQYKNAISELNSI